MARSKTTAEDAPLEEFESVEVDDVEEPADELIDEDLEDLDELDEDVDEDEDEDSWSEGDEDEDADEGEESDGDQAQDLDELESEELEMLTEDELAETLVVDEAAEMRAIRRAELAMDGETGSERGADEFLCQGCFLVLATSQLADKRRKLCVDCAG